MEGSMDLPLTYTDKNETGCCAVPNVAAWDEQEVTFENKRFIRMHTRGLFHVPLNMSKVMTSLQSAAEQAGAEMKPQEGMILSRELSPWKAEQLYAVSKEVPGSDNLTLSGKFMTKVCEGPYQNAKQWYDELVSYVKQAGKCQKKCTFSTQHARSALNTMAKTMLLDLLRSTDKLVSSK
jgi:effector-binding domain-containing protein